MAGTLGTLNIIRGPAPPAPGETADDNPVLHPKATVTRPTDGTGIIKNALTRTC